MQTAAIEVHTEDCIPSATSDFPRPENNSRTVRGNVQGAIGCIAGVIEFRDVIAACRFPKQSGDGGWSHDLPHSRTIRTHDIEAALNRNRFWAAEDGAVAVNQKKHPTAIALDFQAADAGGGGINGQKGLDGAPIGQSNLASLGVDDLRAVITDIDVRAAIALGLIRIDQALAGTIEIHGVNLVGPAIMRVRNYRTIAADRKGCSKVRTFVGKRCNLMVGYGADDR